MRELLQEIRHLRLQMERCIDVNNDLRNKLEEMLTLQTSPQHINTKVTNMYHMKETSPSRSSGKIGQSRSLLARLILHLCFLHVTYLTSLYEKQHTQYNQCIIVQIDIGIIF